MPIPTHCPNPSCPHFHTQPTRWKVHFGFYDTAAHGRIRRYRCRSCGATFSDQTESMHYFAKRRLPLKAISTTLTGGSSMREIAKRYHVTPAAIQNAVLRLGRQAMISHIHVLDELPPQENVVFDGLRSSLTSQDYPCDITTVLSRSGETVLTMTHAVMRRGGTQTKKQKERTERKYAAWKPPKGETARAISLTCREILDYTRYTTDTPIIIDTDEHPTYRSRMENDPCYHHLRQTKRLYHIQTPGSDPRTTENRLFPVNYVDRLLRHRAKEHTRETIAFGRNGTMQMHRAWIFAWNHNCIRPWRERQKDETSHAEQTGVSAGRIRQLTSSYYTRRRRVTCQGVPESIRKVFQGEVTTPPVRWQVGQTGTSIRVPAYALRDLLGSG